MSAWAARQEEQGGIASAQESREFHERVRAGFRLLAAEEPERWLVVDASLPVEQVSDPSGRG